MFVSLPECQKRSRGQEYRGRDETDVLNISDSGQDLAIDNERI
jgi:hypothetical protein